MLVFEKLNKHIPSHVSVRGWNAFVKYNGQPQTCRVCDQATLQKTAHIIRRTQEHSERLQRLQKRLLRYLPVNHLKNPQSSLKIVLLWSKKLSSRFQIQTFLHRHWTCLLSVYLMKSFWVPPVSLVIRTGVLHLLICLRTWQLQPKGRLMPKTGLKLN